MHLCKHAAAVAVLAAALAACSVPPAQNYGPTPAVAREKVGQDVAPFIGQDMRASMPINLSAAPREDAPTHAVFGKFRVDSTAGLSRTGQIWVHAVFDIGGSGYFITNGVGLGLYTVYEAPPPLPETYPTFIAHLPPEELEKRRFLPGIRLGMTQAEVLASAWGKPLRTKEILKQYSDREAWYYPEGNTLFFSSGQLYAIEK